MKVILFGTGDYYNRYKKWFENQEVLALLDNSRQKQYMFIDGIEVLPPEECTRLDYDAIVILSFYITQMKRQLISLGVDENRIWHFYDLHWLLAGEAKVRPLQYFLDAEDIIADSDVKVSKILLMSNDLTLGGPAIALFHMAVTLKRHGYTVLYASMLDGPLKEELLENRIPVVVDENLQIATMQEREWVSSFSLLICNTLNFYVFLSERNADIPVIWWLHEAAFFYGGVNEKVLQKINRHNLNTVTAGPVPATAIRAFLPDLLCDELLYGVADAEMEDLNIDNCAGEIDSGQRNIFKIVRFITIGFLEPRKGQDLLIHAIRSLPDGVRQRCRFYIVGHGETLFGEQIRSESANLEEIIFTGSVERREIHKLLSESDMLICPSRQDPMPTVAAEAMMHSVPCMVSDATGTAAYIQDGEDGIIFPNEDVQRLANKIEWCARNPDRLRSMGKQARKLYEKYFSLVAFEQHFGELVKTVLES